MSERDPIEEAPPGAQVALPIAGEYLIANLGSIDAVDSRAMSLMAFNLAAIGSYLGAVVALGWRAECVAAPAAFFAAAIIIGMWGLRRRKVPQFPSPVASLSLLRERLQDDELAWIYLIAIAEASVEVDAILERKARLTFALFLATVSHLAAIVASAAICSG